MKIRKNDTVTVIAGNDKGRSGKVLKVFPKTLRIIIEGINLRKRHTKPTQRAPTRRNTGKRSSNSFFKCYDSRSKI